MKRSTSGLPKIPHIFPEPFVSGASTRLRGHCSKIACLLPGSVCPAHALLSASASWAESTSRGVLLEKRAASRKDRPGVLYRTPPSYCPSGLRRDASSGPTEKCEGPNILPPFPGSWCEGDLPFSTRGQKPVFRRTAPPNLSWRHLSRPPSFCRPSPWARPIPSTDGFSKGTELQRRPGSPWHGVIRDPKRVEELEVSAGTEGAACEAGPTEVPKTLRPWGPTSFETLWEGEGLRVWMKPGAAE